ncbi:hypothetical protein BKA64DRAFT_700221 [Cadophora sp. MPI-SDFR-AT-0126]|nr:hypothetical protein BKA64DRAFT_700221 [Leotiomycetes sp. MPI-SDFR-AT-0126]
MATVIGATSGAISILQFVASLFAGQRANICTVRVGAALNGGEGPSGGDGSINSIRLHTESQQIIGNGGGGYIGSGGFRDFQIQQINQQQAAFVTLYSSNDALCIPYVTTTWVDGGKYGWVGDWGQRCSAASSFDSP